MIFFYSFTCFVSGKLRRPKRGNEYLRFARQAWRVQQSYDEDYEVVARDLMINQGQMMYDFVFAEIDDCNNPHFKCYAGRNRLKFLVEFFIMGT